MILMSLSSLYQESEEQRDENQYWRAENLSWQWMRLVSNCYSASIFARCFWCVRWRNF